MLLLLGVGAILALLAGLNVIGFVPRQRELKAMIVRDDEYLDFSKVPESRGIPPRSIASSWSACWSSSRSARRLSSLSGYGHHWPAETTLRVPLNNTGP